MQRGEAWILPLRRALEAEADVRVLGSALQVRQADARAVLDLADLAARYPDGLDDPAAVGVATRVLLGLRRPADLVDAAPRLIPCLWRGDDVPPPVGLLRRPWQARLWLGYGTAEPECTLAVTQEQADAWGVSGADIDRAATRNLAARAELPERVLAGVLYAYRPQRRPETGAVQVLAPGAVQACARRCRTHRLLVGLPHRGLALMLAAPEEPGADPVAQARLDRARLMQAREHRRAPYPLAEAFFAWEDIGWTAAPAYELAQ